MRLESPILKVKLDLSELLFLIGGGGGWDLECFSPKGEQANLSSLPKLEPHDVHSDMKQVLRKWSSCDNGAIFTGGNDYFATTRFLNDVRGLRPLQKKKTGSQ